MGIIERINQLTNLLKDLDVELKRSESAWFQSLDCLDEAKNAIDEQNTDEGLRVMAGQYKQVMLAQIDLFRTNSKIIRIVSPQASNFLDDKINEFEKNDIEFQKLNFRLNVTQDEIEPLMLRYHKLYEEIHESIKIFRIIIQDTMNKIK